MSFYYHIFYKRTVCREGVVSTCLLCSVSSKEKRVGMYVRWGYVKGLDTFEILLFVF